jgi:hypothetical protein
MDGKLHFDPSICSTLFLLELKYWGFNEYDFSNDCCCQIKFVEEREECAKNEVDHKKTIFRLYFKDDFGEVWPKAREFLWNVIDKPIDPLIKKVCFVFQITQILYECFFVIQSL